MNFIRNHFANLLTLGNLFSGCVGIINLISGNYEITAICIIVSLVLDFFDGFVARILKSDSDLGVQLDSLADMISFGFLPGMVMYKALEPFGNEISGIYLPFDLKYFGFLITVFSALRLAIFNVDTEQKYYFKGLNTPTNTILIFGYFYVCKVLGQYSFLMINPVFLLIFILISSWLLISPIKMISLKFQSKKLKDNYPKIALLIGVILILIFFKTAGIPLAVIYYILISLIFQKKLGKS